MIEVALTTVTFVAAVPPKLTVAPLAKFVPVIVTLVPPLVDPVLGETLFTVGGVVDPDRKRVKRLRIICWIPEDMYPVRPIAQLQDIVPEAKTHAPLGA